MIEDLPIDILINLELDSENDYIFLASVNKKMIKIFNQRNNIIINTLRTKIGWWHIVLDVREKLYNIALRDREKEYFKNLIIKTKLEIQLLFNVIDVLSYRL
tara:strand:- start:630 stop:935 length:306 start_codon:yes stop_codon:yes gene_type:complete